MKKCDCCGNTYDKSFEVSMAGATYTFDSFECAAHKLAPTCDHCGCRILGHGIEASGKFFCCAHCAKSDGVAGAVDRVTEPAT
jgi:hypothetical protein